MRVRKSEKKHLLEIEINPGIVIPTENVKRPTYIIGISCILQQSQY